MIILRLAALTCVFYMSVAIVMYALIVLRAELGKGGVVISMKWPPFVILFGIVWFISFTAAWKIVARWVATKVPH